MTVKIKGSWKKDSKEYNGLDTDEHRKTLIEHPVERRYAVISYDVAKIENLVSEGGTMIPQAALVQIEPVDGDDLEVVRAIIDSRFRTRTGRNTQPSLFDTDDPEARNAAAVLAGGLPKREVKCGATSTHPEHEGDGWICRGLATLNGPEEVPAEHVALAEELGITEAGGADSGRRELPAAPEFSDQAPDKPARRAGGRRKPTDDTA